MSYDGKKQIKYRLEYKDYYQDYEECPIEELFLCIKADSEVYEIELTKFNTCFEPIQVKKVTECLGVISGKALISIGLLIISSTLKNNSTSDIFTSEASKCLCMIGDFLDGLEEISAKTMTDACLRLAIKYPWEHTLGRENNHKAYISLSIHYLSIALMTFKNKNNTYDNISDANRCFRSSMLQCCIIYPDDIAKKESEKLSEIVLDFLKSGKHLFMV